ncbi:MAG: UbiD family decarboxylase [Candidatus Thermoplasmatota archaeon]|nr:UbiD family decarboxylase [Candidatus Thermoplasmatota archaeon]
MSLREFVNVLDEKGLLVKIKKPVDIKYEIATLMKMLDGKPVLFEQVKNFKMPVVANVCSTRELIALGLGVSKNELVSKLAEAIDNPKEPKIVEGKGYEEIAPDLTKIPILTYYPFDGGPYITSGIAIANDKELGLNASYHRMMVLGKDKLVLRILPRHFDEFLKRGNTEFAICIGNSMPVLLASAVSAELGKSELSIANALEETNLILLDGHKVPQAEIIMIAEMTGEEHDEGPFLDLTETPDIVRKQKVARIKKIFTKKNPAFHALLPGGLEHKILMGMPREPTIFREVNKVCECKEVLITPGGCSWLHAVVSIKKKNADDGKKAIEAAFRGHASLKHVWIVDDDIDIHNPNEVEWAMATRFQGSKDLVVRVKEKGSSLDPSSDLATRETTKVGFDATIPWEMDKGGFKKPALPMKLKVEDYL